MKKLLSLALIAAFALVVVGCKNDQEKAADAAAGAAKDMTNAVPK